MDNDGGEKNKVKKALSQFVEAKGNMTIILDSLEEAFNEITLLVQGVRKNFCKKDKPRS